MNDRAWVDGRTDILLETVSSWDEATDEQLVISEP